MTDKYAVRRKRESDTSQYTNSIPHRAAEKFPPYFLWWGLYGVDAGPCLLFDGRRSVLQRVRSHMRDNANYLR